MRGPNPTRPGGFRVATIRAKRLVLVPVTTKRAAVANDRARAGSSRATVQRLHGVQKRRCRDPISVCGSGDHADRRWNSKQRRAGRHRTPWPITIQSPLVPPHRAHRWLTPLVAIGRAVTTLALMSAFVISVQCSSQQPATTAPIVAAPVSEPAVTTTEPIPATPIETHEPTPRVANPDPASAGNQPDFDKSAAELKRRMDPQLAQVALGDATTACTQMLDAAREFYEATELDEGQRELRLGELNLTRADDMSRCVRETSVKAATCVRLGLQRRDSEFPWLLDQCTRAYPLPTEYGAIDRAATPALVGQPGKSTTPTDPPADELEMTFVGDIMFGRYRDEGFDPIPDRGLDPFVYVKPLLAADLVFANLETPVVENLPVRSPIGARFRFGASLEMAQLLRLAGIDVVSLANNHAYDLRELGQIETPRILARLGITPIGAASRHGPALRVETIERKGWRVGMVAVTTVRNAPERDNGLALPFLRTRDLVDRIAPLLRDAASSHDVLIVSLHWGTEYAEEPSLSQRQAAHGLVEAGADLIIGHHPHVLQALERHEDGLIAYSLGNFLFENTEDIPRQTAVLRVAFRRHDRQGCLDLAALHPVLIRKTPIEHPVPARGPTAMRVRSRIVEQAKVLGTTWDAHQATGDVVLRDFACRHQRDDRRVAQRE